MSINEVRWLSECGSTNAYAKEHFEEFGPAGAVYTGSRWPSLPPCRCWPASLSASSWPGATAWTARSNGPMTCC